MLHDLNQALLVFKAQLNRPAILAFSAGVDSVFLLHFLMHSPLFSSPLTLLYCRHGMRSKQEEEADIALAKLYAKQFSLKWIVDDLVAYRLASQDSSVSESSLRDLRLQSYQKQAQNLGVDTLFSAHHKDDHLETVLMQLFRGSKTGLKGLQMQQKIGSLTLIKPLLSIHKTFIYSYVNKHQLDFREDMSNQEAINPRNRLRLEILPKLKQDFPALLEHVDGYIDYVHSLEQAVLLKTCFEACDFFEGGVLISKVALKKCTVSKRALLGVFFYRLLKQCQIEIQNQDVIERLIHNLDQHGQKTQRLCKDWVLDSDSKWMLLKKGLSFPLKKPFYAKIKINQEIFCPGAASFLLTDDQSKDNKNDCLYLNGEKALHLRFIKRSDLFCPKGQKRPKKVFDLYKKAQIPALERPFKLALLNQDNDLFWLEDFGICERVNTKQTKNQKKYRLLFKPNVSFAKLIV